MKTQFELVENENTPMCDYEVVQFAKDSGIGYRTKVPTMKVVQGYLFSKGYDEKKHFLSPGDFKSLKVVIEHYYSALCPLEGPEDIRNLFNIVGKNAGGAYWINRPGRSTMYGTPTNELTNAVNELGLIYKLTPDNFYFQVNNDRLYIKYQSIIGSRKVANLKECRT